MTLLSSRNFGTGNVSLEAEFPFKCVFICHSNRHEFPSNLYDSVYTVSFRENVGYGPHIICEELNVYILQINVLES